MDFLRYGSHCVKFELAPGESKQIIFVLGYQEVPANEKFDPADSQIINKKAAKEKLAKYLQPKAVDAAFNALREYWDGLLSILRWRLRTFTPIGW